MGDCLEVGQKIGRSEVERPLKSGKMNARRQIVKICGCPGFFLDLWVSLFLVGKMSTRRQILKIFGCPCFLLFLSSSPAYQAPEAL